MLTNIGQHAYNFSVLQDVFALFQHATVFMLTLHETVVDINIRTAEEASTVTLRSTPHTPRFAPEFAQRKSQNHYSCLY